MLKQPTLFILFIEFLVQYLIFFIVADEQLTKFIFILHALFLMEIELPKKSFFKVLLLSQILAF